MLSLGTFVGIHKAARQVPQMPVFVLSPGVSTALWTTALSSKFTYLLLFYFIFERERDKEHVHAQARVGQREEDTESKAASELSV